LHDLAGAQRITAHDEVHAGRESGQEHGFFRCRVAATNHRDLHVAEEEPIAEGEEDAPVEEMPAVEEALGSDKAKPVEDLVVPQEEKPAEEEKHTKEKKSAEKEVGSAEPEKSE